MILYFYPHPPHLHPYLQFWVFLLPFLPSFLSYFLPSFLSFLLSLPFVPSFPPPHVLCVD